jgi:hypothetical protein
MQIPRELVSNAVPPLEKAKPNADFMVEPQLAPRLSKADSFVPKLKPFMAMKRAKPAPNALRVCVGLGCWRTSAIRLVSFLDQGRGAEKGPRRIDFAVNQTK